MKYISSRSSGRSACDDGHAAAAVIDFDAAAQSVGEVGSTMTRAAFLRTPEPERIRHLLRDKTGARKGDALCTRHRLSYSS
jgi:hypothetical protein